MRDQEIRSVQAFADAVAFLRRSGVIRSTRFVGDLGEWYAEVLFGGSRSTNQAQPGWDIDTGTERLQVKAQRYDKSNRWNYLGSDPARFSHLVVIILQDDFRIRAVYKAPSVELVEGVLRTERPSGKLIYHWDDLEAWRVDLSTLPSASTIAPLICGATS